LSMKTPKRYLPAVFMVQEIVTGKWVS
jgi:hypothetical protein